MNRTAPLAFLRFVSLATLLAGLTACVQTQVTEYQETPPGALDLQRTVEVELAPSFYGLRNDCVTIVPQRQAVQVPPAQTRLERAFERQLRERFRRVIGDSEREQLARDLVLDLTQPDDRHRFSRATGCPNFFEVAILEDQSVFAVVWTQRAIGAEVRLTGYDGEIAHFKARHQATRRDGGMPLSPLSAVVSAIEATHLQADSDVDLSLADDVARRMIGEMPHLGPV